MNALTDPECFGLGAVLASCAVPVLFPPVHVTVSVMMVNIRRI